MDRFSISQCTPAPSASGNSRNCFGAVRASKRSLAFDDAMSDSTLVTRVGHVMFATVSGSSLHFIISARNDDRSGAPLVQQGCAGDGSGPKAWTAAPSADSCVPISGRDRLMSNDDRPRPNTEADADAPGNFVDDEEDTDVPEPNEPA